MEALTYALKKLKLANIGAYNDCIKELDDLASKAVVACAMEPSSDKIRVLQGKAQTLLEVHTVFKHVDEHIEQYKKAEDAGAAMS